MKAPHQSVFAAEILPWLTLLVHARGNFYEHMHTFQTHVLQIKDNQSQILAEQEGILGEPKGLQSYHIFDKLNKKPQTCVFETQ